MIQRSSDLQLLKLKSSSQVSALSPKVNTLEPGAFFNYTARVLVPYGITNEVQWELAHR